MTRHSPSLHAGPRSEQIRHSLETVRDLLDGQHSDLQKDPSLVGSLGVPAGSPFAHRPGLEAPGDALMSAAGRLPALEHGVSRPPLDLVVGVPEGSELAELFHGSAELLLLPALHSAAAQTQQALSRADVVLTAPDDGSAEQLLRQARRAGTPSVWVDLHQQVPDESSLSAAALCDRVAAVSEQGAEIYADSIEGCSLDASGLVTLIHHPVSPLRRSPLGSREVSLPWVNFTLPRQSPDAWPEQTQDHLHWILDGVIASGSRLTITVQPEQAQDLPVRFLPYTLRPAAEDSALDRATDIAVVIDPVPASQSLISHRALELQASGTMVLSTYNQGINSYDPQVVVANSTLDIRDALLSLDEEDLHRAQTDGLRRVFSEHHATDVLADIARAAGADLAPVRERLLAVLVEDGTEHQRRELTRELAAQTAGPVLLVTWDELPQQEGRYEVLLPVSAELSYSPTYAENHLTAFRLQQAPVSLTSEKPEQVFSHLDAETALKDRSRLACSAWWRPAPEALSRPETLLSSGRDLSAFLIDACSRPREDQGRRPGDPLSPLHAADESFPGDVIPEVAAHCQEVVDRENLLLSVIVPIYNNGAHLRHKAFASLRRSSIFERMHILLVSDGSTDPLTLATIDELCRAHTNVTAFHHAPGGSGSASRPRNTGLELVRTPYVTYLDPDNEAVEDGFARLLEEMQAYEDIDFAIGNMSIWTRGFSMQHYGALLQETYSPWTDTEGTIEVPEHALEKLDFRPMGIQTLVARTRWLQSLEITQPLGAVGQDSYFFQQMLHYAERIRALDIPIHTYYAAVSDSTVNTINPRYFKKYLPLDSDRARWLEQVGLLDAYKRQRLEKFLVTWHLPKLRKVGEDQWLEAAENIAELLDCYGPAQWQDERSLAFFDRLEAARRSRR